MFGWLSSLLGIDDQNSEPFSELGDLGTRARVVIGSWLPGPILPPALVNPQGSASEPLRRTRTVRGPLVMAKDQMVTPTFQGEATPPASVADDVKDQAKAIEDFAAAMSEAGFPS